ncbi:hypothetical protein GOP47_0000083 [Adiantum capillus-veneris]|uniref:Pentatricopeptide repeat-containing protein n=1 Tax=Adiantum capillus-veneris TaxID=13818 RepID=A0A9D4VD80_ADICA|nr:hypothetical protein GOP47_0000083 [Adiantum capillus-veneris]
MQGALILGSSQSFQQSHGARYCHMEHNAFRDIHSMAVGGRLSQISSKCNRRVFYQIGYAQHGQHSVAYELVQRMKRQACNPDIITWNAMFAGLVLNENVNEAFCLFSKMVSCGMQPDNATFVSMVKGCSLTGALSLGELFYAYAAANSFESNTALCNACIEMYSMCGSLREAILVFERLQKRDRITWNSMIAAFAHHNSAKLSSIYFGNMQREGVKPDNVTFTSLLSACGHLGLPNEANLSIESINQIYMVSPTMEQVNCVVDVLGRSGHLAEAESMLTSLLPYTNLAGWTALLNSCRLYGNVDIGSRCFRHMVGVDDSLRSVLTFMSNVLGDAEFLDEGGSNKHVTFRIGGRYLPASFRKADRLGLRLKQSDSGKAT